MTVVIGHSPAGVAVETSVQGITETSNEGGTTVMGSDNPKPVVTRMDRIVEEGQSSMKGLADLEIPVADFLNAKYGGFIHWDMSSLMGGQISWERGVFGHERYDQLYKQFNPKGFDPVEWAGIISRSGLKYVTIVPKHHSGFCMWNTKTTDYEIMHTPFGRDWLAELVPALREAGVKVGLYFSIMDWHQPSYSGAAGADLTEYREKIMYPQLEELLTGYGDIFCIWFDGNWDPSWTHEQGRELLAFCRKLQPKVLVSNRVAPFPEVPGPSGSITGSFSDERDRLGDYLTPERMMGAYYTEHPWETCLPLDKHNKWSWMPPWENRPKREILSWLTEAVWGGGNLLIALTPDPEGRLDSHHAERLLEVGAWLYLHGDHFYGTRPGPYKPGSWGGSLEKGDRVYLYISQFPEEGGLRLPVIDASVKSSRLLSGTVDIPVGWEKTGGEPVRSLKVSQDGDGLLIEVLPAARHDFTIVELQLDRPAADVPRVETGGRMLIRDHTIPPRATGGNETH